MLKKKFTLILAAMLALTATASCGNAAEDEEPVSAAEEAEAATAQDGTPLPDFFDDEESVEGIVWEFDNGSLYIKGNGLMDDYCEGEEDVLERPWEAHVEEIKEVIIGNGVKNISDAAFLNCVNLEKISIGEAVETIGYIAFQECNALRSVTVPGNVKTVGDGAFIRCSGLETVIFENGVETIGEYAFEKCVKLSSVTFSETLTTIGGEAFENCEMLTSVTFPNSLTTVGRYAFSETGLTNINFNEGLTVIESNAFAGTDVSVLHFPSTLTTIERKAFAFCGNLVEVVIPESVTTIGDCAFENWSNSDKAPIVFTIENSPENITVGEKAFAFNHEWLVIINYTK